MAARSIVTQKRKRNVAAGSRSRQGADSTNGVNRFVATAHVYLPHDSTKVILHGKFGKIKAGCNLFVGETSCDERDELALSVGEPEFDPRFPIGKSRVLAKFAGYLLKQVYAQFWRAYGLALRDASDCGDDIG